MKFGARIKNKSKTIKTKQITRAVVAVVVGFTTTYAISVYITTDVVGSNLDQSEVYNSMG